MSLQSAILKIPHSPFDQAMVGAELLVVGNVLHDPLTSWGAGEEFGGYPRPIHKMVRFLGRHLGECLAIWEMENKIKKIPLPYADRLIAQASRIAWLSDDLLRSFLLALYREEPEVRAKMLEWLFERIQEKERLENKTTRPETLKKIQERRREQELPVLIQIINKQEGAKGWLTRVPLTSREEREEIGLLIEMLGIDQIFQACHPN